MAQSWDPVDDCPTELVPCGKRPCHRLPTIFCLNTTTLVTAWDIQSHNYGCCEHDLRINDIIIYPLQLESEQIDLNISFINSRSCVFTICQWSYTQWLKSLRNLLLVKVYPSLYVIQPLVAPYIVFPLQLKMQQWTYNRITYILAPLWTLCTDCC